MLSWRAEPGQLAVGPAAAPPRLVDRPGLVVVPARRKDKTFSLATADKTHYRSVGDDAETSAHVRPRTGAAAAAAASCGSSAVEFGRAGCCRGRRCCRAAAAPGDGRARRGREIQPVTSRATSWRGQAQVGQDLRAGAVRVPVGRMPRSSQRHVDVGVAHRLGERATRRRRRRTPSSTVTTRRCPAASVDQLGRDRAHPARVDDGDAVALLGDPGGDLHAELAEGADRDEQDVVARRTRPARRPGRPGAAPAGPRRPHRSGSARWSGRRRRRPPRAAPRGAWRRRGARRSAGRAPHRRPTCPRCRSGSARRGR